MSLETESCRIPLIAQQATESRAEIADGKLEWHAVALKLKSGTRNPCLSANYTN